MFTFIYMDYIMFCVYLIYTNVVFLLILHVALTSENTMIRKIFVSISRKMSINSNINASINSIIYYIFLQS